MGISKEAEVSIAASSMFPGFRFSPTDEELLLFYLKKKFDGFDESVEVINEVDICKNEPWDLPEKSVIKSDHEWFFFSPRGKKYPNGSQSKRATETGYWKATGKERGVKSGSELIGTKRTLVFHMGRAPKGERTEWIMHEYCLLGNTQKVSIMHFFGPLVNISQAMGLIGHNLPISIEIGDSLVICRLRRKSDSNSDAGTSLGASNSNPSLANGEGASSGSGWDTNRMSTEKAVECCSKLGSSSNESHSVEQNDHASESGQKLKEEGMEPESSSQPKAHANNEDDCFADILKDNIIELDESAIPPRSAQLIENSIQKTEAMNRSADNPFMSRINLSQGTANRRIRLKKIRRYDHYKQDEKNGFRERSRLSMRYVRKTNHLYVLLIVTGLLATFIILLGGTRQVICLCAAL